MLIYLASILTAEDRERLLMNRFSLVGENKGSWEGEEVKFHLLIGLVPREIRMQQDSRIIIESVLIQKEVVVC